ncbi:MAG TPA: hypothetical protein EYG70_04700 [Sulfurimonas sp.]|nr:hypothetical protein [Sulfurimonas sp.]
MFFNRQVLFRVLVKNKIIEIRKLRIKFDIKKNRSREQNKATIEIYNLNETTRANIKNEGVTVELFAGYASDVGLIFRGDIREVSHKKTGADMVTRITAGDGDNALRKSTINVTLPSNSNLKAHINALASKLEGIKIGKIIGIDDLEANKRATTFTGSVREELDRLATKYDFAYTIENHIFSLVRNKQHTGLSEIISVESGMIEVPIATEKGVDVKTLLNNNLKCNDLFRLESKFLKRNYRIDELTFKGDTHSREWFSLVKGVNLA